MHLKHQLLLGCAILYVLGLVMIFNTSSAEAIDLLLSAKTHQALLKQLLYGVMGLFLAYSLYKVGIERLFSFTPLAFYLTIFFLLLVFVPGLGIAANGSRRWVNMFGMSLQPSEFAKFTVPLYFAYSVRKFYGDISLKAFLQIAAKVALPIVLILLEPNNGTAGVIALTTLVVCFFMQVPAKYWAVPFCLVSLVGFTFAMQLPYVTKRLQVYLHPELDLLGKGHQPHQAKIASGSGGLLGKGPGKSLQKMSYLPEAQNDYIAAIFAEEFGFLGMFFLITIYGWICVSGYLFAYKEQSIEGISIIAVFTFLCTFQAFLNMGVVSGLLPSTGLNLPFFSQGGSSLLANIGALGAISSVSTKKRVIVEYA